MVFLYVTCLLQEKGEKGEPGAPVFGPVSHSVYSIVLQAEVSGLQN